MTITAIEQDSKQKFFFWIEGEKAFYMTASELKNYNLYSKILAVLNGGERKTNLSLEIPDATINILHDEVVIPRGKKYALDLLADRDYTRKLLRDKLTDRGYNEADVNLIFEYVDSFHYIDDVRYSVNYIGFRENTKSSRYIRNQLMLKGVSPDDINKAYSIIEEEHLKDGVSYKEVKDASIIKAIKKKLKPSQYDDRDAVTKTIASLVRQGFEYSDIRRLIDSLKSEYMN